ncbi:MAG: hypothetical protein AAFQ83_22910 [Bacteroidota bacterium]
MKKLKHLTTCQKLSSEELKKVKGGTGGQRHQIKQETHTKVNEMGG